MTANEIRQKYLDFFKEKGHEVIPSASVVPENDPTTLFITAGMHPLVPYFMGRKHSKGKRLTNSQKCVRTIDIDDVGDNRHLTFFEMLGNWSLGDYFKKEAIEWSFEFLTDKKWLGLEPSRIYVTVFAGDDDAPRDDESIKLWKEQFKKAGIDAEICEEKEPIQENSRIFSLGKKDNWWGPAGETGPCGPDTEMFYKVNSEKELKGSFQEVVDSFQIMEVWNDVFMEYEKKPKTSPSHSSNKGKDKKYEFVKLGQKNVDTGMGLERITTVLNGEETVFETELFLPIIEKIEEISGKNYGDENFKEVIRKNGGTSGDLVAVKDEKDKFVGMRPSQIKKSMRIIADHIKASVFIIADGIEPSNTGQGYVLRRLIRRAIREGKRLEIENNFVLEVTNVVQDIYEDVYPKVGEGNFLEILNREEEKFRKTLSKGLKSIKKLKFSIKDSGILFIYSTEHSKNYKGEKLMPMTRGGDWIANFYQTYGIPFEMFIEEIEKIKDKKIIKEQKVLLEKEFNDTMKKHQQLSRTASAGMFKGGLADDKEQTTQLHTTAHLMLAGLRKVLGDHIHQKGSNINGERIRFDFSHPEKMTDEEKKQVEDFVNEIIDKKIPVEMKEMSLEEAKKNGAEGAFENKYGDKVKVYNIEGFSKEMCGGPHVKNTGEIKGKFKIKKEQSSSAGVRRIKAILK